LRENLAKRVKRIIAPEDYDPTGKRRAGGPKFDKRNGALTAAATRPFTEFAGFGEDGDTIPPDEAIEGRIAKKDLLTTGDEDSYESVIPMPADRESLKLLGRLTQAERWESWDC